MIYMPHNEPFGFAPLEANACGTPVVALAEGGVKETVVTGVNGTLVSDEDPRTVAAAIANGRLYRRDVRLDLAQGSLALRHDKLVDQMLRARLKRKL